MKKIALLFLPLAIIALLLFPNSAYSAHIIGGEFIYQCGQEDNYDFSLILYRDCAYGGANFDSPMSSVPGTVTIYRGDELFQTVELGYPEVIPITSNVPLPGMETPPQLCYEQGTYHFSVTLPAGSDYNIVYQRCCLTPVLTNIPDPSFTGLTIRNQISGEVGCNSTPAFTELLLPVVAVGAEFTFDMSAVDADGDSLSYRFGSPLQGGGINVGPLVGAPNGVAPDPDTNEPYDTIPFLTNYTRTEPLGAAAELVLDPLTGLLRGTPMNAGKFLMAILVEEYRAGARIGSTQRVIVLDVFGSSTVPVIEAAANADEVLIWPNPTRADLRIALSGAGGQSIVDIRIFDTAGRSVRHFDGAVEILAIGDLPPGVYSITVQFRDGSRAVKRVVVE